MKAIINIALIVALVSLVVGIISRVTLIPVPLSPGIGIKASSFLAFTNTCIFFAIALILSQLVKSKQ